MNDYDYQNVPSPFTDRFAPSSYPPPAEQSPTPVVVPIGDEIIEEDNAFSLAKYQVVRREFFSHIYEPSITFSNYKIGLNSSCIKRLPETDYIQILVNRETRKLAVRPCHESDPHSFQWCTNSGGKRKPRQVVGKMFFMKICALMGWNPDYRYKILGKLIHANGEYLFIFDLSSTEMYQRIVKEGEKPKTSKTPIFPAEWQDQFGVPYEEHKKSLQINIFENYAVYGLKERETKTSNAVPSVEATPDETQAGGMNIWQNR